MILLNERAVALPVVAQFRRRACRKSRGRNRVEFKRDMSDDLPISDFADQLHDDLLVKRLTDSDNTEFSNDLEKGARVDEVPKTASGGFFYSLVRWQRSDFRQ